MSPQVKAQMQARLDKVAAEKAELESNAVKLAAMLTDEKFEAWKVSEKIKSDVVKKVNAPDDEQESVYAPADTLETAGSSPAVAAKTTVKAGLRRDASNAHPGGKPGTLESGVSAPAGLVDRSPLDKPKFNKTDYMRVYMQKRRAAQANKL